MLIIRFGPFCSKLRNSCTQNEHKRHEADQYRYESVPIFDIIDLEHASRHSIDVGDRVLVRDVWPVPICAKHTNISCRTMKHARYIPASVVMGPKQDGSVSAQSGRDQGSYCFLDSILLTMSLQVPSSSMAGVLVYDLRKLPGIYANNDIAKCANSSETSFWVKIAAPGSRAGCHKVTKDNVVWIPTAVFERITLEQLLPPEAREWVHRKTFLPGAYPNLSAPGYPDEHGLRAPYWRNLQAYHPTTYLQFKVGSETQVSKTKYCLDTVQLKI
ncbi:unnamed protein product [Echinostoma caproni]|uniref:Major sperm protein n=1 Tax=Echinostoma caproni TaxID=27848 RepID=A0A183ACD6_9TREM|nr:unnamed protein product [Echinostoma caproni]